MYVLILVVHIVVSLILVGVILLQGGRGGLGEALGGAASQSLFGGGAKTVLTKFTAVGAGVFMATCLSLAALSTHQGRSVIEDLPAGMPAGLPSALPGAVPVPVTPPESGGAPSHAPASAQPAAAPAVQGPAAMPPSAEPSGTSSSTTQ